MRPALKSSPAPVMARCPARLECARPACAWHQALRQLLRCPQAAAGYSGLKDVRAEEPVQDDTMQVGSTARHSPHSPLAGRWPLRMWPQARPILE